MVDNQPTPKLKLRSKSYRILKLIELYDGMYFTEIQEELWKMTHPDRPFTRALRGYWCTNLLGGMHYHGGLLNVHCIKSSDDGKWRLRPGPVPANPWACTSLRRVQ